MVTRQAAGSPRRGWLFVLALWFALSAWPVVAQERQATEAAVKAAFVFKFGGYVDWPDAVFAASDSPLRVGVVGSDALAGELERIVAGRRIDGRPVHVSRLAAGESSDGLHVLFVGAGAEPAAMPRGDDVRPLLTITEVAGAVPAGSVINFVVVDAKVRFDIAMAAAQLRQLRISSRLLAVARRVEGAP